MDIIQEINKIIKYRNHYYWVASFWIKKINSYNLIAHSPIRHTEKGLILIKLIPY